MMRRLSLDVLCSYGNADAAWMDVSFVVPQVSIHNNCNNNNNNKKRWLSMRIKNFLSGLTDVSCVHGDVEGMALVLAFWGWDERPCLLPSELSLPGWVIHIVNLQGGMMTTTTATTTNINN